ncbi:MAG: hypothetical protein OHK0036_09810 [Bacteroidia bacterium]
MEDNITIQDKNYSQMLSYIKRQSFSYTEKIETNTAGTVKRLDVSHGKYSCVVKVHRTGTIQVQGQTSKLKDSLTEAKTAIENEEEIHELLPFEIEKFTETLKTNIPHIDPIIIRFIDEAINCYKGNSLLGCAFLLGAASEKAIWILIDTFGHSIEDPKNREKFNSRVGKGSISRAFDEFKKSFGGCKTKPQNFVLQDLQIKIEAVFQFCRICRNEVGHPQIVPNLDKGVILANLGQFIKYIETIYGLIDFYATNKTEV